MSNEWLQQDLNLNVENVFNLKNDFIERMSYFVYLLFAV